MRGLQCSESIVGNERKSHYMYMSRHTRALLFLTAVSALCFAFAGCSAKRGNSSQILETKTVAESFIQSFNKGDADACIGLLSSEIVVEQKALQDSKSQDVRSVHEGIKANIALKHNWEIIKYLNSTENSITIHMVESGEDIKLAGVDSISFEMTFEVKDGKIARMVSAMDKETLEQIVINTAGGIGVQFDIEPDKVVIIGIAANFSAEKAGLKQGYEIIAIGGMKCSDMKQGEQMIRIRGPVNSKVLLQVRRPDTKETYDVELTRVDVSKFSSK